MRLHVRFFILCVDFSFIGHCFLTYEVRKSKGLRFGRVQKDCKTATRQLLTCKHHDNNRGLYYYSKDAITSSPSSHLPLVCVIVSLLATGSIVMPTLSSQRACADGGCCQQNPPFTGFGNRAPALSVKTTPSVIVSGANADIFLQFRLYDAKTNETIKYPLLNIAIYNDTEPKATPVVKDFFVSPNGLLTLKVKSQPSDVQVQGNKNAFTNAWQADPSRVITITGPVFAKPGSYLIRVQVFGIDYPTNIFADNDVKQFDTVVHVG